MANDIITAYTAGDTKPDFERTAPSNVGDLTGFTIRLRIRRPFTTQLVKTISESPNAHGEIVDAAARTFKFTFDNVDLVAGEMQLAEIEYDDGSDGIQTEQPIFFSVAEQLG